MMKPNKQHTLLLVIDLQKFLLKLLKKAEPYPPAQVLETNEKLITMMTSKGIPSALVSVTQKFLPQKYRQKSSQLALSKDVMAPSLIETYTKYQPSAYSIPELRHFLEHHPIDTIIITGIVTNNGVLKTAKDFLSAGYQVIVIEDATTARTKKLHDRSITELKKLGAIVQSSDLAVEIV
ncbi:isochorismatase family protein [Lactococcus laudensis]|uniref:isochorismatase family protein n=1 Tax=Pseudolactococcus laudensis TaxID=1494461 RepID=UPI000277517D|nr:Isochorismatase hydrolase [Lactococcus raffinolactis 4877]